MQLVSAQSLDQVLATSGPLAPRRAAEVGRQLLSALSVAHAAGVMHRDVKPSNVLLGSDDRAVLTDFGIATFQGDPKLTQTGMVMGSPGFTAPERIRGEDASPASDLWSLGATLFAAVEGHGPFEKRGGAITTMSAIINEDAPEAPMAGALGPVIAALLRREPTDRPDASAAARMITDVLPLLPDRPPDSTAGYEATALSASSHPGPPQPGWNQPGSSQVGWNPPGPPQPGWNQPESAQPGWNQPESAQPGWNQPESAQPAWSQPGSVPPRLPQPGETSLDFASADQTIAKEPPGSSAVGTDPLLGGLASDPQTAPTTPQPVLGDPPRPGSSWGQGAGAGYPAGGGSASRPEGPPPYFSSWYDPSPRSGAAAQPGSGSAWPGSASPSPQPGSASPSSRPGPGSAQAPQPGYGPAPQPGSASQQPPGPAPWSGAGYEPPRRRRSGAGWKVAIAALAIIGAGAGAATVVLLHKNHSGSPQNGTSATGSASGSPTGTLPPSTLQIVDAINQPATGPLPSGFATISQPASTNETAGFSLAAPTSWKSSTSGYQTYLRDRAQANTNILIDLTPHTHPNNMVQEAQYIESQSMPRFPGYQRIGLAAINIRGTSGSYWKFTWMDAGVQQEAIDLLFVLHSQSYALYMTAPESSFAQIRPIFDEEVETFATVPS